MPDLKEMFSEATEFTTLSKSYPTTSNTSIEISIIIGDIGQSGVSEIWIDNQKVEEGILGSFKRTENSDNLRNRTMNIYTLVADTSRTSNYTEVALHLRGGTSDFNSRLHKEVTQEGESVFYEYEIFFYQ